MLRFAQEPDIVFTEILDLAFDEALYLFEQQDRKSDIFGIYPNLRRIYSPKTFESTVSELKEKNKASGMWFLTDYHYFLIYEVLWEFLEVHNDLAKETGEPILEIHGRRIFKIDFRDLIDQYFFDTDFLINPKLMLNMSRSDKSRLGFCDETFGLVTKLKPHAQELQIKLYAEKIASL